MRSIIILGLSAIAQTAFSQQQAQQVERGNIIMVNNVSNLNYLNNAILSNIKVNFSNNEQKQQVVRTVARVTPSRKYTQVKATNTIKSPTPQVRRRSRPRPVNTTNQVVVHAQNNPVNTVFDVNEMLNASNINVPAQNFILSNNSDQQAQGISNVANEDSNPFVQQESNKVEMNINLDLSLNLKDRSMVRSRVSSLSSSSSHSKSHTFSKKMAKFKRHFFGKLSSHKKGKHRLDVCFNWKK